ncbi:hypothetical protein AVEN_239838-1 [Araneus ventricosus]|uniref:Uncharacterized protein n=1 Tax=Araneus ventricosus TaxID=182803 RepID=A0A4Y2R535_ARAVE|nr:hypothetical protein AVEN_239838-1 [Araneus ventricosus]
MFQARDLNRLHRQPTIVTRAFVYVDENLTGESSQEHYHVAMFQARDSNRLHRQPTIVTLAFLDVEDETGESSQENALSCCMRFNRLHRRNNQLRVLFVYVDWKLDG